MEDEARNCRELLLEMEAGMFGMVILSEIDPVEDLGFEIDRIVCLVPMSLLLLSPSVTIECVRVTPPIDILPLFKNDFL